MEPEARVIGFTTVESATAKETSAVNQPRPAIHHPAGPPLRSNHRREVLRMKGGESFVGYLLSERWWSCTVHYSLSEKRTQPCLTKEAGCEGCFAEMPKRDLWYLNLLNTDKGNCWLEFPQDSAGAITELLAGYRTFRGLSMKFWRSRGDKGVIRGELRQTEPLDGSRLPKSETPLETLWKLWLHGRPGRSFKVPLNPA